MGRAAGKSLLLYSILTIVLGLVPIRPQLGSRKPGRRLPHNVADLLHIRVLRNFDDQFIVDMPADETVFQVLHGITEDVPADRLGDVFDEFRAVGFDERPLFICSDAVIFHAFPAEAVCADPGLHIAEPSAGWKVNKEHAELCAVS